MTSPAPPLRRSHRNLLKAAAAAAEGASDVSSQPSRHSNPSTPSKAPSSSKKLRRTPTPRKKKADGLGCCRTPATQVGNGTSRTGLWEAEVKQIILAIQQGKETFQITIQSNDGTSKRRIKNFPRYCLGEQSAHEIPTELRLDYADLPVIPMEYHAKLLDVIIQEQVIDASRHDLRRKTDNQIAGHVRAMINASYYVDSKLLKEFDFGPVIQHIRQQQSTESTSTSAAVGSSASSQELKTMMGGINAFVAATAENSKKQAERNTKQDRMMEQQAERNTKQDELNKSMKSMLNQQAERNTKQDELNESMKSMLNQQAERNAKQDALNANQVEVNSRVERDLSRLQVDYQDLKQGLEVVKKKAFQMTPSRRAAFTPKKMAWEAFANQQDNDGDSMSARAHAMGSKVLDFGSTLQPVDENGEEEEAFDIDNGCDDDRRPAANGHGNEEGFNARSSPNSEEFFDARGSPNSEEFFDARGSPGSTAAIDDPTSTSIGSISFAAAIRAKSDPKMEGNSSNDGKESIYDKQVAAAWGKISRTDSSRSWSENSADGMAACKKEKSDLQAMLANQNHHGTKRGNDQVAESDDEDDDEEKLVETAGLVDDSEEPTVPTDAVQELDQSSSDNDNASAPELSPPSADNASAHKSSMFSMNYWIGRK